MEITTNPTNLNIYYCENCHGIVATTGSLTDPKTSNFMCPFCFENSLVFLPTEDYKENFNRELFPYPQNIILEKFFTHSHNTLELLSIFREVGALKLLGFQLQQLSKLKGIDILIRPDLIITVTLDIEDNFTVSTTSKNPADIESLLSET